MDDWTKKSNIEIYANCMKEIKDRILLSLKGTTSYLNGIFFLEFKYLQMRKICELFAFSRIITNRKIYEDLDLSFKDEWNFKKILKRTENHPSEKAKLLPEPIKSLEKSKITGQWELKGFGDSFHDLDFLTIQQIYTIYNKTCDYIHAKNHYHDLSKFYPDTQEKFDFHHNRLIDWNNKFGELLNKHIVGFRMDEGFETYVTQMYLEDPSKKIVTFTLEKID